MISAWVVSFFFFLSLLIVSLFSLLFCIELNDGEKKERVIVFSIVLIHMGIDCLIRDDLIAVGCEERGREKKKANLAIDLLF